MHEDALYAYGFKGLLTQAALDSAGRKSKGSFSLEWESQTIDRLGLNLLDEELLARARKMSLVYMAIATFENSIREFIIKKLLEVEGEDWWDRCVKKVIQNKAQAKKDSEAEVRWHTSRGDSLIYFTEFGDLISILTNPQNWVHFEVHIGDKDWAKQIITTMIKSRNVIMHSGELAQTDIERIGMNIRDWVNQVG